MDDCRDALTEICTCGCQKTGKIKEKEQIGSSLASLQRYEQTLEAELKTVRLRIKDIETQNR